MNTTEAQTFEAGDVKLQPGINSRGTKLVYQTVGQLNADRSKAVLWPTPFDGSHWSRFTASKRVRSSCPAPPTCVTHLYVQAEDNRLEVPPIQKAQLLSMPSDGGHRAGMPAANPVDEHFINKALRGLLEQTP